MEKWEGKLAVVTGASAGIGKSILEKLARSGVNVIGLARRVERIEEHAKQLENCPGKVFAHQCDVSDHTSIVNTFKWIEEKFGTLNILINNAGTAKNVKLLDPSDDVRKDLENIIDVNFRGLLHCTREAFRIMSKSDEYCCIININSIMGKTIPFLQSGFSDNIYGPTKYGVTAMTEVVRQELIQLKQPKIRVSGIYPGVVETEIYEVSGFNSEAGDETFTEFPIIKPDAIANGVIFILSTPYSVNVTDITIKPTGELM